jgi:hypothetical protein
MGIEPTTFGLLNQCSTTELSDILYSHILAPK